MTCTCKKHHLHFSCYCMQTAHTSFMKMGSSERGDAESTCTTTIDAYVVQCLSFTDLIVAYLLLPVTVSMLYCTHCSACSTMLTLMSCSIYFSGNTVLILMSRGIPLQWQHSSYTDELWCPTPVATQFLH